MKRTNPRSVVLYCFSPLVILVTFLSELVLTILALVRYRDTRFGQLAVALFALLALFQFSELAICQGGSAEFWGRVGLFATAFLPMIGIDLIDTLTGRSRDRAVIGYAIAAAFAAFISFMPGLFTGAACTGKFVIVYMASKPFEVLYGVYYLASLFVGIALLLQAYRERQANRTVVIWMLVGYLSFIVPTAAVYVFATRAREGVGSILCGFALLMAFIVAGRVLPLVHENPRRRTIITK